MHLCECGCGQLCKRRFVQGHNAKRGVGGSLKQRLLSKITIDEKGCWVWAGTISPSGYGELRVKNGKSGGQRASAHRLAYEVFVGPIPDGLWVLHRCDNKTCINPAHLFLGTAAENSQDMVSKGRSARGERQSNAKLTLGQVREIKQRESSLQYFADKFAVHISTISKIRCGNNWAWV